MGAFQLGHLTGSFGPLILGGMGDNLTAARENRALNIIRSISALLVILGHVRILFFEDYATAPHTPLMSLLYSVTSLGGEAVIVFFVLSGYWVGGGTIAKLRRGSFQWGTYAGSRLTRLWIVLLPALLLTLIVDQAGRAMFSGADIYAHTADYAGVPETPSYSLLTFLGNMVFTQSIHVSEYGLNKPLWSLAYEFWYYLMFPSILTALWKGGSKRLRVGGALLFVIGAVISGPAVLVLFPAWLVGAVVSAYKAPISQYLSQLPGRMIATIQLALVVVTLGAMVANRGIRFPLQTGAWIIAILAGCMILSFADSIDAKRVYGRFLSSLSQTAHFSYSLYAIHMPIVAILAAAIVPRVDARWPMDTTHIAMGLVIVALLGVIAYFFAFSTEQRTEAMRRWVFALLRHRRISPHARR